MSMFLVHLPSNPTLPTSDTLITVCVPRPPHFHIVHCLVYPATPSQMSPHQHHIDHLIVVVHEWLILQVQLDYIIIFFLLWLKNTVWVQIWKVPEPHLNHTRPQCSLWFSLRTETVMNPPYYPSNPAEDGSIVALKRCTHDFAHHQTTHDTYKDQEEDYEDGLAIGRLVVM
jgi:hypothetical protein